MIRPLLFYFAGTLLVPALNGSFDATHAAFVVAVPLVIVAAIHLVRRRRVVS